MPRLSRLPCQRRSGAAARVSGLVLGLILTAASPLLAEGVRPKPRPDPQAAAQAADTPAGAYLAARQASAQGDFAAAVPLYARALAQDPSNPSLLDGAVTARLVTGDVAGASQAARLLLAGGSASQAAVLAVVAADVQAKDFAAIRADLSPPHSIGTMADGLILAWAQLGQGSMTDALAAFDALAASGGMKGFALYHKALAMALSGDFEGAHDNLSSPDLGRVADTRRGVLAKVQVLAQLDRRDEALEFLGRAFPPGRDAGMDQLRAALSSGQPVPFDMIRSPAEGLAEVLFDMSTALTGQAEDAYVLMFARTAAAVRPDHVDALILSAQLLLRLDQPDLAAQTFALVPQDSPAFVDAEVGRANAMLAAGQTDAAVGTLQTLSQARPQDVGLHHALADMLRRLGRFQQAVAEYNAALALLGTPQPPHWPLHYARAICLSELKDWPAAEAGFRQALALNPDQPQVLNYLGYSYVDRGENLDEALKMIQRAVLAAPDEGYIVDSLAWALFRLGRFKEAVVPMERASLLEPIDPVVTDHLGDVYWSVGRKMEARFQWRRALSFNPAEAEATRIRRKLEVGLDQVQAEEKAGALPPPGEPAPPDGAAVPGDPPAADAPADAPGNDG